MPHFFRSVPAIAALLTACTTALSQETTTATVTTAATTTPVVASTSLETVPKRTSYTHINVDTPTIAMTFDDGPHPELTPKLLDILKQRHIKATFFILGELAQEYPDIVKRMADEGHEIGNHTWSHPNLGKMGQEAIRSQLERSTEVIKKITGITPTIMRPPYGSYTEKQRRWTLEEFGMPSILWAVDPLDWKNRNSAIVRDRILKATNAGDIVLSHDIHATTVAAMPSTLDQLIARGFQFVTVSELIAMEKPLPPKPEPQPAASPSPEGTPAVKTKQSRKERAASSSASPEALPNAPRQTAR